MSILKYKYQAHKFVNYIFYIIVFAIGFFLGFTGKNIDFKSLISNILFIDNVQASTNNYGSFVSSNNFDSNCASNDECLLNILDEIDSHYVLDYDLSDFNYYVGYKLSSTYVTMYLANNSFTLIYNNSSRIDSYADSVPFGYYSISFYLSNNNPTVSVYYSDIQNISELFFNYSASNPTNNLYYSSNLNYINFNPDSQHYVDFTIPNLSFNENLFANNENFKQVCVGPNANFTLSTTEQNTCNSEVVGAVASSAYASCNEDFMWFKYKLNGSLKHFIYDSSSNSKGDYTDFNNLYFSNKEEIDLIYSSDGEYSSLLSSLGYSDKYSYYGWNAVPFKFNYINDDVVKFDIYSFTYPKKESIAQLTPFAPMALYNLGFDEDIQNELNNDRYCFYINKKYEINYVDIDEFGDYEGNIVTPNGALNFKTTYNADNLDTQGVFSISSTFISKISDCITFINDNIYNLYLSMPVLLRMFIITFFVISSIKLIINMIVR